MLNDSNDAVTVVPEGFQFPPGSCVNTTTMRANLDDALRSLEQPSEYQVVDLDTLPDGDVRRGYPTPTVLVANRDLFGMAEPQPPFPTPA